MNSADPKESERTKWNHSQICWAQQLTQLNRPRRQWEQLIAGRGQWQSCLGSGQFPPSCTPWSLMGFYNEQTRPGPSQVRSPAKLFTIWPWPLITISLISLEPGGRLPHAGHSIPFSSLSSCPRERLSHLHHTPNSASFAGSFFIRHPGPRLVPSAFLFHPLVTLAGCPAF